MTTVQINGQARSVSASEDTPLLWVLRDELGMTGTKFGCGMALCGACTVHVDGEAMRSCVTPVGGGRRPCGHHHRAACEHDRVGRVVQQAWVELNVAQCGYCQTGQIMTAVALLQAHTQAERRAQIDARHERQHLPLRHLPAHPRRHPVVGAPPGGRKSMSAVATPIGRRGFLQLAAGGLTLAVGLDSRGQAEGPRKYGADAMPGGTVDDPLVFVAIAVDGTVTIVAHRAEMGTGVRTSLPMIVADEMEARWDRVRIVQAGAEEARYGNQNVDGSRSVRHFLVPMRHVGAAARQMLEAAAAARWAVPLAEVQAVQHEVLHKPSGRRLGYGELAAAAR